MNRHRFRPRAVCSWVAMVGLIVGGLLAPGAARAQTDSPDSPLTFDPEPVPPTSEPAAKKAATRPARAAANAPSASSNPVAKAADDDEEVVVISASRTPQKVEEAPSIVTVIGRSEILSLGYRSLGEILRNVVGLGINDNGHWPDTGVRGINDRTTYGDKLLFLVDGHDMAWRQFNRNYHNPSWVAVDEIARIEVVRGPGSALWGANALNGVINIVTRPWDQLKGAELVFGGDHRIDAQSLFARAGTTFGPVSIYTSFNFYSEDADAALAPLREFSKLGVDPVRIEGAEQSGLTLNVRAKLDWLQLSFHRSRYDTYAPLSTFSVIGGDDSRFVTDRYIVGARARAMLAVGVELTAEVQYDDYRFGTGTVYEANPGSKSLGDPAKGGAGRYLRKMAAVDRRYEARLQLSYLPTVELQAVAGAELEILDLIRWHFPQVWAAAGLDRPTFTNWRLGVYGQVQYSPSKRIGIIAGMRFDYDQIYRAVVAPRAGVVLRLPGGFALKGLFGMAYKAPSFHDLYYFRSNAFYGNPSLKPERAVTGEAQLLFKRRGLDLRLTGFYTRITNLIAYARRDKAQPLEQQGAFPTSQRPDGTSDYSQKSNKAFVTTVGAELEAWVRLHRRLSLQAQGTYRLPTDDQGQRLNYSSRWVAGGALRLELHKKLDITFRGLVVGDKLVPRRALNREGFATWTADIDPTQRTPVYFVGTLVLRAHSMLDDRVSLTLKLDNITATAYWDAGRDVLYPQRGFVGTLLFGAKL